MERLPGHTIHEIMDNLNQEEKDEVNYDLGRKVALLVQKAPRKKLISPPITSFTACNYNDFYAVTFEALGKLFGEVDTKILFTITIERSIRVLKDKDVPYKNILMQSIRALENKKDEILAFPSFIHIDDFHDNNIMTDGKRITGFIDLEFAGLGNEVIFLGNVLRGCAAGLFSWKSFRKGYEEIKGEILSKKKLSVIKIAAFLPLWIEFASYWSVNDVPWWAKEENMPLSIVNQIKKSVNQIESIDL